VRDKSKKTAKNFSAEHAKTLRIEIASLVFDELAMTDKETR